MTHFEKQPSYFHFDNLELHGGETDYSQSWTHTLESIPPLQRKLVETIETQIRLIASQVTGSRDSASSGEYSNATSTSSDESSSPESINESGVSLPSHTEMCGDEQSLYEIDSKSESTLSSQNELCEEKKSLVDFDRRTEVTLPSYTEMCGDEESIMRRDEREAKGDDTTDDGNGILGEDLSEEPVTLLPGCFGDCMVGNQLPQDIRLPKASSLRHYRYIGKRRPNYDEFEEIETRSEQEEVTRVPPADSTVPEVETFVNRWLRESGGKAEAEKPNLRFSYDSAVRKTCRDILPRLSSSSIEISSAQCRNRKRKLAEYEIEADEIEAGLSSRSETDISRPQPRRPIKRRKISSY